MSYVRQTREARSSRTVEELPLSVSPLQLIETRLGRHRPGKKWLRQFMKRSAVAMILQVHDDEPHILMIKRAEREGDPWSGHMAFPGGRMDAVDRNGFAVDEVIWVPFSFLMNENNLEEMLWQYRGADIPVPCYNYQGRCIWGLSLMMLGELLDIAGNRRLDRSRWRVRLRR
jgi:hypothetical protein